MGCDAEMASLVDFTFCLSSRKLVNVEASFVDLTVMEDSVVVKKIVEKHMAGIRKMEEEVIVDESVYKGDILSSEGTRCEFFF
eukprot:15353489-Ditylum_brightwellii.AAC.1